MSELGLPEILAAAVLFTLVAYALLAGADFGAGLWDLLASGPRAERQRETIAHAIGPIWEANHVWLILAVVLTFAAFPPVFATLAVRLHIPLALILLGIVLRGSSFVFRTYDGEHAKRRWGRRFAVASAVTPLLLGVSIGAITAPLPPVREDAWFWSMFMAPWLGPLPIATGVFVLAQFAFLAAVYLTVEAQQDAELADDFRRRALRAAVALGAAAALVLVIAAFGEAPEVAHGLLRSRWALPVQLATAVFAVATIALLWRRAYHLARLCAAAQVALILLGWGLAMYPYLIAGSLTIRAAASPEPVLALLLGVLVAGLVFLIPALVYLLRTFKGPLLSTKHIRVIPKPEP